MVGHTHIWIHHPVLVEGPKKNLPKKVIWEMRGRECSGCHLTQAMTATGWQIVTIDPLADTHLG